MPNENSISNQFLKIIEDYIPFVTSDKNKDGVINFLILIAAIAWIYCGIKIYFDIGKRYKVSFFVQIIALIFGVLTGPVGLLVYILMRPNFTQEEVDFIKIEHKFYYQQAAKVLECIKCNAYVLEDQTFCTECGVQNRYECENCNTFTDYNDKYCFQCGFNFKGRQALLMKKVGRTLAVTSEETSKVEFKDNSKPQTDYLHHLKRGLVKIFDFGGNIKQTLSNKESNIEQSPLALSQDTKVKADYAQVEAATDVVKEDVKPSKKKAKSKNKNRKSKK